MADKNSILYYGLVGITFDVVGIISLILMFVFLPTSFEGAAISAVVMVISIITSGICVGKVRQARNELLRDDMIHALSETVCKNCDYNLDLISLLQTDRTRGYRKHCGRCSHNFRNAKKSGTSNMFSSPDGQPYEPVCQYGCPDCALDPAYIKNYKPDAYEKRFSGIEPKDVCDAEGSDCYNCLERDLYERLDKKGR